MAPMDMENSKPARRWRRHWCCVFGNCSGLDCLTCGSAYFTPCVAYGITSSKITGAPWWKDALKFFAFCSLMPVVHFILELAIAGACPAPDPNTPPPWHVPADANPKCNALRTMNLCVLVAGGFLALVWAIHVGSKRRADIRRHLGLDGVAAGSDAPVAGRAWLGDCCLHYWCLCCAVAQEMRTVLHAEQLGLLPVVDVEAGRNPVKLMPPEQEEMEYRAPLMSVEGPGKGLA